MRANLEKHFWFYSGSWWTPRAMIWDCGIKWSRSCTRNAHSSVWLHMFFRKLASWRFGALRKSRNRIFICSRTPSYDSCFRGTWMRRYIVFHVFGNAHFPAATRGKPLPSEADWRIMKVHQLCADAEIPWNVARINHTSRILVGQWNVMNSWTVDFGHCKQLLTCFNKLALQIWSRFLAA